MMIPNKIHYCWFGGKPLPRELQRYVDSWHRVMPDAEIIEWNESNYDITKNSYMAAAYKEKKWGFVPDYARLDIVYEQGGIYLDTDVEIIRDLRPLLNNHAFCGFEVGNKVALGLIFAAERGHPLVKEMRDAYERYSFYKADGTLNLIPAPILQTDFLRRKGLNDHGRRQEIDGMMIYEKDFFAPFDEQGICQITPNTYCIHHYSASWLPWGWRLLKTGRRISERFFGPRITRLLVTIKRGVLPKYRG